MLGFSEPQKVPQVRDVPVGKCSQEDVAAALFSGYRFALSRSYPKHPHGPDLLELAACFGTKWTSLNPQVALIVRCSHSLQIGGIEDETVWKASRERVKWLGRDWTNLRDHLTLRGTDCLTGDRPLSSFEAATKSAIGPATGPFTGKT